MKPSPKGWPRLSVSVYCRSAAAEITWLEQAIGFETRLRIEGEAGRIEHSELLFGEALVMVGEESRQAEKGRAGFSPLSTDGKVTGGIMLFVDDVDAACERARGAGGTITYEPTVSDYGEEYWVDKSCQVRSPEGHLWWLVQRIRG